MVGMPKPSLPSATAGNAQAHPSWSDADDDNGLGTGVLPFALTHLPLSFLNAGLWTKKQTRLPSGLNAQRGSCEKLSKSTRFLMNG